MDTDDKQPKDEAKEEAHMNLVGGHGGVGSLPRDAERKVQGGYTSIVLYVEYKRCKVPINLAATKQQVAGPRVCLCEDQSTHLQLQKDRVFSMRGDVRRQG